MYAIIKTGGKQYRVEKDAHIDIELLEGELGAQVEFGDILFVNNGKEALVGNPMVSGYKITGEIIGHSVGPKIESMKYRPRQHNRSKWGHRQHYSRVKIVDILSEKENHNGT